MFPVVPEPETSVKSCTRSTPSKYRNALLLVSYTTSPMAGAEMATRSVLDISSLRLVPTKALLSISSRALGCGVATSTLIPTFQACTLPVHKHHPRAAYRMSACFTYSTPIGWSQPQWQPQSGPAHGAGRMRSEYWVSFPIQRPEAGPRLPWTMPGTRRPAVPETAGEVTKVQPRCGTRGHATGLSG